MKKHLTVVFLAFLAFNFCALADIIEEPRLDFPINQSSLEGGDVQIAITLENTKDFFNFWPFFQKMDFYKLASFDKDKILAAKYAFTVDKGINAFNKLRTFNVQEFERISRDVKVNSVKKLSENKTQVSVTKKIHTFRVSSTMELTHLNAGEMKANRDIMNLIQLNSHEIQPQMVYLNYTYDIQQVFNKAFSLCFYQGIAAEKTLVSCYIMSSLSGTAANSIGLVVDIQKAFKEEILYALTKIKEGF